MLADRSVGGVLLGGSLFQMHTYSTSLSMIGKLVISGRVFLSIETIAPYDDCISVRTVGT